MLSAALLLIAALPAASAWAHELDSHAALNFDGRIPGQPDVKKFGDTTYRFLPGKRIYEVTRPGEPPQYMHVDPPASPNEPGVGGWVPLPTNELAPICRNWGNRIIINYDGSDPVPAETLRSLVRRMNWKIADQSSRSSGGGRTVRMVVECDASGQIAIYDYSLEQAHTKFGSPEGANAIKVLTFKAGGTSGAGPISTSNVKSRENGNAKYTSYPWMSQDSNGLGWQSHNPMHELFHSMGATQGTGVTPRAPYSTTWTGTNGFHCVDGWDVMCYEDGGGGEWGPYTETRCPASSGYNTPEFVPLDCGNDTYFDAAASPETYLASYWNIGEPENPYLEVPTSTQPSAATWTAAIRKAQIYFIPEVDLRGSVVPNGDYATYWFEWGTTSSYGSKTTMSDAGWGTSARTVSTRLVGGFNREQLYHFRIVAKNEAGTVYGADQTFEAKNYFAGSSKWGSFASPAHTMIFGDVNGDGKEDLVGWNPSTDDRQVGLSTGSSFAVPGSWGTGLASTIKFALADVNGDGKADAIEKSSSGEVRVGLSTGTGFASLIKWTTWSTAYATTFIDVNGDGRDDIVGRDPSTGNRQVGLSTGTSFAAPSSWGAWSAAGDFTFDLADVNGDGKADTVGRSASGEVRVGLSTGTGFAASEKWTTLSTTYAMTFADVNGGGREDIVGRNPSTGDRLVGLSTGTSFATAISWGTWSAAGDFTFDLADVSGDGKADSVGRHAEGEVRVGLSTGTTFGASEEWTTWSAEYAAHFADVNADGRDDMITRYASGDRQVALSTGTGFGAPSNWGTGLASTVKFDLADVNGDGKADAIEKSAGGEVRVGLSTGSNFAALSEWATWSTTYATSYGDVDGDGRKDIIGWNSSTGARQVALSTGTGFGAPSNWGTGLASTVKFDLADVNGDGKADAIEKSAGGEVRVGLSTGSNFAALSEWTAWPTSYATTFIDANGDGRDDIVGRNAEGERLVGLSTGTSFGLPLIWGFPWSPVGDFTFDLADVSGDGRADSVGINAPIGEVRAGLSKDS
jgi:hypothetical protein